jgi:hypothetical protein
MVERIMPRDYRAMSSSAKPTVGSQTLKVGPAVTRIDCGIRGQDSHPSLAHNSSACLECPIRRVRISRFISWFQ